MEAVRASLQDDVAVCVLVKHSHQVLDVEAFPAVVKELLQVLIVELLSVELLATKLVNNVTIASLDEPSKSVHTTSLLVDVEVLLGLQELGNGAACTLVILEL